MIKAYGILSEYSGYIDTSKTLKSAKNYATRKGINKVYRRLGYYTSLASRKVNGNWDDLLK